MGVLRTFEQSCKSAADASQKQLLSIRDLLDEKLAEASEYYAHYRQEKKLGPLELILLQPQTFALYRDVQVWNGASPNQLKPIHVITNPKTEAFFRGLKIST